MSRVVAAILNGGSGGAPLQVFPGYCQSVGPSVVQITGDTVLTGLEYLGVAGTLVPGRVLLLRIPDGRPVILGNLNT
jgi:hypothetical protein